MPLIDHRTQVGIHADCEANEIVSIHNRVAMCVPPIISSVKAWLDAEPVYAIRPWTEAEVLARLNPKRRRRYAEAYRQYHQIGLLDKHANVQAFLKAEKVDDVTKDPRMIQHRHPIFTAKLAQYIGPIEKVINQEKPVWYAKNMNSFQVAKHLRELWDACVDPHAILCDAKRFDAHEQIPHLLLEHSYYLKHFPSRFLRRLLAMQLHNRCWTKHGVRYNVEGGRMSGDRNTSIGNSLINRGLQVAVVPNHVGMAIVGDDAVIIADGKPAVTVDSYLRYGFRVELDIVTDFEALRFCQMQPVAVPGGWRMSRDPRRAMLRDVVTIHGDQAKDRRLEAISMCLRATGRGLPVFQALADYLHRDVRPLFAGDDLERRARAEPGGMTRRNVGVHPETRASFAAAFDFPVDQQLAVEEALRTRQPYDLVLQFMR